MALLTILAIIVALLTAAYYLLQIVEWLEKRIPLVIGWIKKHKCKRVDIHSTESSPPSDHNNQQEEPQESPSQRIE